MFSRQDLQQALAERENERIPVLARFLDAAVRATEPGGPAHTNNVARMILRDLAPVLERVMQGPPSSEDLQAIVGAVSALRDALGITAACEKARLN